MSKRAAYTILRDFSGSWATERALGPGMAIDWPTVDAMWGQLSGGEKAVVDIAGAIDENWPQIDRHHRELIINALQGRNP